MTTTLPLNVSMSGKTAVIAGGGAVALRKARTLLEAGAHVRLVAPVLNSGLGTLSDAGKVDVRYATYTSTDLDGAFLAIAATDNPQVNRQVATDAHERGILVAVVDQPEAGDCIFPATVRRGNLEIAISTGGRCPSLAAEVKRIIERVIGEEYAGILDQLAGEREKLLTDGNDGTYNANVLRSRARKLLGAQTEPKEPP